MLLLWAKLLMEHNIARSLHCYQTSIFIDPAAGDSSCSFHDPALAAHDLSSCGVDLRIKKAQKKGKAHDIWPDTLTNSLLLRRPSTHASFSSQAKTQPHSALIRYTLKALQPFILHHSSSKTYESCRRSGSRNFIQRLWRRNQISNCRRPDSRPQQAWTTYCEATTYAALSCAQQCVMTMYTRMSLATRAMTLNY
jgi:hypothetical protein